jgi:glutamyl-tRNA reductase
VEFLVVGLNHRTASLEIRERLAVPKAQLPEALHALSARVSQGVILSTCNRSEVYTAGTEDGLKGRVEEFLVDHFGVALEGVDRYLYSYQHEECVRHLFRVSSSLDSMIMGEGQILRQVRDAFEAAAQANTVQAPLSRVFHHALRVGKRVRRDTTIGKNALSVSRACVELARRILGDLSQLRVMVVGTGDAGKLAARALQDSGVKSVVVTNRTFQRAADLVGDLDAQAVPFEDMPRLLGEVDIVVGCTGSPGYVLDAGMVENAIARRPDKPLFLIDIAVPRDIDPDATEIPNVHLHDVDDLQAISNTNRLE